MGVGDSAVLARLFAHLHDKSQIPNFLHAFQELRSKRSRDVLDLDLSNNVFMLLSDENGAKERDRILRARHDAGREDVFEVGEEDGVSETWGENWRVFGYDAEDDADGWWVQWGLMHERAKGEDLRTLSEMMLAVKVEEVTTT